MKIIIEKVNKREVANALGLTTDQLEIWLKHIIRGMFTLPLGFTRQYDTIDKVVQAFREKLLEVITRIKNGEVFFLRWGNLPKGTFNADTLTKDNIKLLLDYADEKLLRRMWSRINKSYDENGNALEDPWEIRENERTARENERIAHAKKRAEATRKWWYDRYDEDVSEEFAEFIDELLSGPFKKAFPKFDEFVTDGDRDYDNLFVIHGVVGDYDAVSVAYTRTWLSRNISRQRDDKQAAEAMINKFRSEVLKWYKNDPEIVALVK